MNPISIRPEKPADYDAIRSLIVEVFHETFGSGEAEATVVEQLRRQPYHGPNVSLVAEEDGALVGHVFFSAVQLEAHPDISVCALAPLGVYRSHQRRGIGSQLVQDGVAACAALGYRAMFVQGSLDYYPRFGFVPIDRTRLHTTFESDHDMAMALEPGLLDTLSGLVAYPEPWHVFL